MPSDIRLEDERLRLDGPTFDLNGHTVILDYIVARDETLDMDALRRPLVHDAGDSLTINWRGNYSGGVGIVGAVSMPGSLAVRQASVGTLHVELQAGEAAPSAPADAGPAAARAQRFGGLVSDAGITRVDPGAPTLVASDPFEHLESTRSPVDVGREIAILRRLLANLNERLKALEAR
jgi:hypothetical protein